MAQPLSKNWPYAYGSRIISIGGEMMNSDIGDRTAVFE